MDVQGEDIASSLVNQNEQKVINNFDNQPNTIIDTQALDQDQTKHKENITNTQVLKIGGLDKVNADTTEDCPEHFVDATDNFNDTQDLEQTVDKDDIKQSGLDNSVFEMSITGALTSLLSRLNLNSTVTESPQKIEPNTNQSDEESFEFKIRDLSKINNEKTINDNSNKVLNLINDEVIKETVDIIKIDSSSKEMNEATNNENTVKDKSSEASVLINNEILNKKVDVLKTDSDGKDVIKNVNCEDGINKEIVDKTVDKLKTDLAIVENINNEHTINEVDDSINNEIMNKTVVEIKTTDSDSKDVIEIVNYEDGINNKSIEVLNLNYEMINKTVDIVKSQSDYEQIIESTNHKKPSEVVSLTNNEIINNSGDLVKIDSDCNKIIEGANQDSHDKSSKIVSLTNDEFINKTVDVLKTDSNVKDAIESISYEAGITYKSSEPLDLNDEIINKTVDTVMTKSDSKQIIEDTNQDNHDKSSEEVNLTNDEINNKTVDILNSNIIQEEIMNKTVELLKTDSDGNDVIHEEVINDKSSEALKINDEIMNKTVDAVEACLDSKQTFESTNNKNAKAFEVVSIINTEIINKSADLLKNNSDSKEIIEYMTSSNIENDVLNKPCETEISKTNEMNQSNQVITTAILTKEFDNDNEVIKSTNDEKSIHDKSSELTNTTIDILKAGSDDKDMIETKISIEVLNVINSEIINKTAPIVKTDSQGMVMIESNKSSEEFTQINNEILNKTTDIIKTESEIEKMFESANNESSYNNKSVVLNSNFESSSNMNSIFDLKSNNNFNVINNEIMNKIDVQKNDQSDLDIKTVVVQEEDSDGKEIIKSSNNSINSKSTKVLNQLSNEIVNKSTDELKTNADSTTMKVEVLNKPCENEDVSKTYETVASNEQVKIANDIQNNQEVKNKDIDEDKESLPKSLVNNVEQPAKTGCEINIEIISSSQCVSSNTNQEFPEVISQNNIQGNNRKVFLTPNKIQPQVQLSSTPKKETSNDTFESYHEDEVISPVRQKTDEITTPKKNVMKDEDSVPISVPQSILNNTYKNSSLSKNNIQVVTPSKTQPQEEEFSTPKKEIEEDSFESCEEDEFGTPKMLPNSDRPDDINVNVTELSKTLDANKSYNQQDKKKLIEKLVDIDSPKVGLCVVENKKSQENDVSGSVKKSNTLEISESEFEKIANESFKIASALSSMENVPGCHVEGLGAFQSINEGKCKDEVEIINEISEKENLNSSDSKNNEVNVSSNLPLKEINLENKRRTISNDRDIQKFKFKKQDKEQLNADIISSPSPKNLVSRKTMADIMDKLTLMQQEISDLKLQLNASQQKTANLELEVRQKEEIVIKTQAESMKKEQGYIHENKLLKEELVAKNKQIEQGSSEALASEMKSLKLKNAELVQELNARNNERIKFQNILQGYDKELAKKFEDNRKLKEEHDTATQHLANLEVAFSDVHQKYERCKSLIQGLKANEEELTKSHLMAEQLFKQQEEKYDSLKAHATSQIEKSNKEIMQLHKTFEQTMSKQNAVVKRLEIKVASLEVSLDQKTKENAALAALCDEVTGKRI